MNRRLIAALVAVFVALCGGEKLRGQTARETVAHGAERAQNRSAETQVGRPPIQTMSASEVLRRAPPQPFVRPPAWPDVEQRLEALRHQRMAWGANHEIVEDYYGRLASPASTGAKTDEEHLTYLEQWRTEIPQSSAARVVAAKALLRLAWEARGSGWAATVTEEGWKSFAARSAQAHRLLDEAIELGVKDGEAHALLVKIGYAEGHPREQVRAWIDAGMKLDPTYYSMYHEMAVYLLPRWMGEAGEIEEFAADIAKKLPGDNGLEAYARIAFTIQRYECGWGETLLRGKYDHETLMRAAEVMLKRYPGSARVAHFAALCAMVVQDHAAAKRIRPLVKEFNAEDKIWAWQNSLKHFRDWSGAAESPRSEENWVFAGLTGCPGIAFGNEPQHVLVAQQFGTAAINLMDVRTGSIKLALPSPGGAVNGFDFDPGRQWAVLTAWSGPLNGWMLWDLSGTQPPIPHTTKEMCRAVAIHPKRPLVFWGEGQFIRSWDVLTDAAGPEIETKEHVQKLQFSPDGTVLAANNWICDVSSGTLKYKLASGKPGSTKVHVRSVVAIDDEGRAWATVATVASKDPKVSLVRFSADGTTWETLLDDIVWDRAWLASDRKLLATAGPIANGAALSRIEVWNLAARKRVKQFDGHWNSISQLAFSPDGSKLASVSLWADAVKIWPLEGLAD